MKQLKSLLLLAVLYFMAGCTTSRVTTYWVTPDAEAKAYTKVMVIGVIKEADRSIREKMENHLVGDLKNLGYNAFSSLQEYGPKGFDKMNEEQAYLKLKNDHVDAVITVVLLDKQKEQHYVPSKATNFPYMGTAGYFWNYYRTIYDRIQAPGYYSVSTRYFWESNLYDLDSKLLVYSVQTQSFDPASAESMAHEYGRLIVQNMLKHKVLAKMPGQPAMVKTN